MRALIPSIIFLTSFFMTFYGFGQADSSVLRIVVSEVEEWKANEGETFKIKVGANGGSDLNYKFGFSSEQSSDMKMDGVGNFRWSVNFGIVSVFNSTRIVPITFFVHNESNESDSVVLEIIVLNKLNSDGGEAGEMAINFPNQIGWNLLDEGDTLSFQLIDQLTENQKALEKEMKKAKRGKKNRQRHLEP